MRFLVSLSLNSSSFPYPELTLRSYPNGPVVQTLASGEIVTAQHRDGAWLQITTAAGQSGWAFSQYLGCR